MRLIKHDHHIPYETFLIYAFQIVLRWFSFDYLTNIHKNQICKTYSKILEIFFITTTLIEIQ